MWVFGLRLTSRLTFYSGESSHSCIETAVFLKQGRSSDDPTGYGRIDMKGAFVLDGNHCSSAIRAKGALEGTGRFNQVSGVVSQLLLLKKVSRPGLSGSEGPAYSGAKTEAGNVAARGALKTLVEIHCA